MKKLKKNYKIIVIIVIVVILFILSFLIYKNLFEANGSSNRLENIEEYKLTKKEISSAKEVINELENVEKINISSNYKIIKIYITLKEDLKFKEVKEVSNKVLESFKEENLKYYDVEIFIDCSDKESETYPKIGYKHKTNSEFTWNR